MVPFEAPFQAQINYVQSVRLISRLHGSAFVICRGSGQSPLTCPLSVVHSLLRYRFVLPP